MGSLSGLQQKTSTVHVLIVPALSLQVAVNKDDYVTAISDYKRIAELAGGVADPGALHPPRDVLQARLQAVEAMQAAWRQQALE